MINSTNKFNNKLLPAHSKCFIYSLWENSSKTFLFLMKDRTIKKCSNYYRFEVRSGYTFKVKTPNYVGYSYIPIECCIPDFEKAGIKRVKYII